MRLQPIVWSLFDPTEELIFFLFQDGGVDYSVLNVTALMGKLMVTKLHQRPGLLNWHVGEIIDFDSFARDTNSITRPPLIMYSLGKMTALSSDRANWREYETQICTTLAPSTDGKIWMARCNLGWDFSDCVHIAEEACLVKMRAHVQVSQWVKVFQSEIAGELGSDDPKIIELNALMLKASFLFLSSF